MALLDGAGLDPFLMDLLQQHIVSNTIKNAEMDTSNPGSIIMAQQFQKAQQAKQPGDFDTTVSPAPSDDRLRAAATPAPAAPPAAAVPGGPGPQPPTPPTLAPPSAPPAQPDLGKPAGQASLESPFGRILNALTLGGFGQGALQRDALEQDYQGKNATYKALVSKGFSDDAARAAVLNASNPAVQSLISASFTPKTQVVNDLLINTTNGQVIGNYQDAAKARPAQDFKTPSGDTITAVFEPKLQGHVAPDGTVMSGPYRGMNLGTLQAQLQKAGALGSGGPAPAAASGAPAAAAPGAPAPNFLQPPTGAPSSPYAIPPTPPGGSTATFRAEASKKAADEIANDRDKGMGAIEFLQQADQARQAIADKGHVIGRFAQPISDTAAKISVNAASTPGTVAAQAGANALANPGDTIRKYLQDFRDLEAQAPVLVGTGNRNMYAQDIADRQDLNQLFTKLAQSGLKATYGSRVTNVDVKQQMQTVPTLTDVDSDESLSKLDNLEKASWRTLQQNLQAGNLNPGGVPPDLLARGLKNGRLDPTKWYSRGS